jgi:hypothetical protein
MHCSIQLLIARGANLSAKNASGYDFEFLILCTKSAILNIDRREYIKRTIIIVVFIMM